MVAVDHW